MLVTDTDISGIYNSGISGIDSKMADVWLIQRLISGSHGRLGDRYIDGKFLPGSHLEHVHVIT